MYGGQKATCGSQFSGDPSAMWVLGMKLRLSSLAACFLICSVILLPYPVTLILARRVQVFNSRVVVFPDILEGLETVVVLLGGSFIQSDIAYPHNDPRPCYHRRFFDWSIIHFKDL